MGPLVGQWLGTFGRAAGMQAICAVAAIALLSGVPRRTPLPVEYDAARDGSRRYSFLPGIAVGFVNVQYPVVAGFLILHLQRSGNAGPMAFTAYAAMILLSRFFLGGLP